MYLRFTRRKKNGKEHRYWSIVESKRCAGGRVVQRPVLYLGEINDSQQAAWWRAIEAFDDESRRPRQLALFPADRRAPDHAKGFAVQVRLEAKELHRPRQWGCGLARLPSLRAVGAGSLLVVATARFARRNQLAACLADGGVLSADRPGQRMAIAPSLV
jgi:hypothetical protein